MRNTNENQCFNHVSISLEFYESMKREIKDKQSIIDTLTKGEVTFYKVEKKYYISDCYVTDVTYLTTQEFESKLMQENAILANAILANKEIKTIESDSWKKKSLWERIFKK